MANRIQNYRGTKANMPALKVAEFGFATDTRELFIGTSSGNLSIGGSQWYTGTAMSGTSTTTNAHSYSACPLVKVGDIYLNTSYGYVYQCTTAGNGTNAKWTYKGNIRGKGISSTAITYQSGTSGTTAPTGTWSSGVPAVSQGNYLWTKIVITYTDSTTSTSYSVARQSIDGDDGQRGSKWYTGTAMSGTSTTTGAYTWNDSEQKYVGDMYLNTTYGYVYKCTTAGTYTTAKWTYQGTLNSQLLNGKAPNNHASSATTYGVGNSSNYGHLKLSDSISSTSSASGGIAATPAAVKAAVEAIILPRLDITVASGTSVTVTDGTNTYTKTSTGTVSFELPDLGSWTITAGSYKKVLEVDAVKIYKITAQTLQSTSWADINKISKAGTASTMWSIGDEKDIVVDGETLTLVILDFNHDTLSDGTGKAGITFGLKNLMSTMRAMNSTNTNSGGFTGSAMYTWLQGDLLNNLPSDLKAVLKNVNKLTSAGNQSTTINTDAMRVFLFSEIEVFGTTSYSASGEGEQYPYFATATQRKKYLSNGAGSANFWWERSPYAADSTSFCYVTSNGSAYANYASTARGVCFGFCV